jgi:uncharacterized protein YbjQ (UPF0145 family)
LVAAPPRCVIRGRSLQSAEGLRKAKIEIALKDRRTNARVLQANAVVGVDLENETIGVQARMFMVSISGTAVTVEKAA